MIIKSTESKQERKVIERKHGKKEKKRHEKKIKEIEMISGSERRFVIIKNTCNA